MLDSLSWSFTSISFLTNIFLKCIGVSTRMGVIMVGLHNVEYFNLATVIDLQDYLPGALTPWLVIDKHH